MDLRAAGSVDLRAFELFDANVQSSGESQIAAYIQGTLKSPNVTGTLEVKKGSFFLNNVPNGLSGLNGTVKFERDRATIQKLTAHSGGGDLSLQGFVTFAGDGPPDLLTTTAALSPGGYVVRWQVLAVDGHITRGDVPFTVTGP